MATVTPTVLLLLVLQATALRAPFPAEKIGKVPRVTCGACRDSKSRNCEKHVKAKCEQCGGYLTPMHIHLDYIGHADVTDRFLEVDPDWNWEPFALDNRGLPALDDSGGMWIRLTILEVYPGAGKDQDTCLSMFSPGLDG